MSENTSSKNPTFILISFIAVLLVLNLVVVFLSWQSKRGEGDLRERSDNANIGRSLSEELPESGKWGLLSNDQTEAFRDVSGNTYAKASDQLKETSEILHESATVAIDKIKRRSSKGWFCFAEERRYFLFYAR